MASLNGPFIGSEAIDNGLVRKHELRSRYRAVLPDVYVPDDAEQTLGDRALAAWLWSHRQGILAGLTASALHGARWVDETAPIELIFPNARRPPGVRTYDLRLRPGETGVLRRMFTAARAAFANSSRHSICTTPVLLHPRRRDCDIW